MAVRGGWPVLLLLVSVAARADINGFDDKMFTARLFLEIPSYQIEIQSKDTGRKVAWKPNIHTQTGIDLSINKFIGFGGAWANSDGGNSAIVYGKTNYQDYRLSFNFLSFHLDTNYNVYKGFYVDNTGDVDPATAATGVKLQDSSMEGANASVNFTWIPRRESFSYSAAIGQDKRQETSGGSWLLGLSAARFAMKSANQLIPTTVSSNFGVDQNIQNATFYTIVGRAGFGYTVAWTKKYFTSLIADFGLGFESRTFGDSQHESTSGGASTKFDAAFSFGYNGDDFLAAMIFTGDDTSYTTNSLNIPEMLGDVKLAIGGHF